MICKVNEQPFSLGEFTVSTKLHLLLFFVCVSYVRCMGIFWKRFPTTTKKAIQQNPLRSQENLLAHSRDFQRGLYFDYSIR